MNTENWRKGTDRESGSAGMKIYTATCLQRMSNELVQAKMRAAAVGGLLSATDCIEIIGCVE